MLFRSLIILLALLVIIAGTMYYVVTYRFKESLQLIVKKESGGKYILAARKSDFSIFDKKITLKNVSLHSADTTNVQQHIDLSIPDVYFSFSSWRKLIFNRKLFIDSLSIRNPHFFIHIHKDSVTQSRQKGNFKLEDFLNFLQRTSQHLNAHSLSIDNLSFEYSKLNGPPPMVGQDINIRVSNFTKVDNNDNHVMASDSVTVSFGRQHWIFPDGIHEMSFKQFVFSTGTQKAELDSFVYSRKITSDRPGIDIKGERFFFNSKHLPDIYQKAELNIDTLFCLNPSIVQTGNGAKKTQQAVTSGAPARNIATHDTHLFNRISVKFINVIDGVFHTRKSTLDTATQSGARKSNAQIYHLVIDAKNNHRLTTDSILINLKDIQFYSKDSMFKLQIAGFRMKGKDALFNGVTYMPSEYNTSHRGVTFKAPELLLKDIDIGDLLRKKLHAQSAHLVKPFITVLNRAQSGNAKSLSAPKKSRAEKMNLFFRFLHHLNDLLDVDSFNLSKGRAAYTIQGEKPLQVSLENLNTTFLLNKLFESDSLVDIKHSIPNLQWGRLQLAGKQMKVAIANYRLDGRIRKNWADGLAVSLANGTNITGKNIYWEAFDWDVFEKTKDIQIDLLKIGSLIINTQPAPNHNRADTKKKTPSKDLPVIRIGKLEVKKVDFSSVSSASKTAFNGSNLEIQNLGTQNHFFTWTHATADLSGISSVNKKGTVAIKSISLNTSNETMIHQVNYESQTDHGKTTIHLPLIKINSDIHSTDLSEASIHSLGSNDGNIKILSLSGQHSESKSKPLKLPSLLLQKLNMKHLAFNFQKVNTGDTLNVDTHIDASAESIKTGTQAEQMATYKNILLQTSGISIHGKNMVANIPSAALHLQNGKLSDIKNEISLTTAIRFSTDAASVQYHKDSNTLRINKAGIAFEDKHFQFHKGQKFLLLQLISKTEASGENIFFKTKKTTIAANSFSLTGSKGAFTLKDFSITPNLSRAQSFAEAQWQNDYISIKGKTLGVEHFKFKENKKDSTLSIQKIMADGILLDVSRDKSIPFRHGIEKSMPTQLIQKIPVPLQIKSMELKNSTVSYHEFSVGTKNWSKIPLTNLNAHILNITNQPKHNDSLKIIADTKIFSNEIRNFRYSESYHDSLSGFTAGLNIAPMDLKAFSQFSKPLAAVSITNGQTDTVFSTWQGNKYASYGKMNFHYRNLRIKMYNKKDTTKRGLIPSLETFAANLILPNKKSKSSLIYFQRDREKFVFNYWIKTQVSGILSTMGIKKDKKYKKLLNENLQRFHLSPPLNPDNKQN